MIGIVYFLLFQFPVLFILLAMMQGGAFSPTGNNLAFLPTIGVIELIAAFIAACLSAMERR